jgi:hypothetical protein
MSSIDNKCKYHDNSKSEAVSKLSDILKQSGATTCSTTTATADKWIKLESSLEVGPPFFGADGKINVNIGTKDVKGSANGCESIIAMNEEYRKTINNVKCTFESIKSESKNTLISINKINVKAPVKCKGDLNINQIISTKSLAATQLTTEQIQEITNNVVDGLKSTSDVMYKEKSGFGSTPPGDKILSNIQSELNSTDIQNKIKENVQTSLNNLFDNNELNILYPVDVGGNCNFNQSIISEVVASTVVNDSFNNMFRSFIEGSAEHANKIATEHENDGTPPPDKGKSIFDGDNTLIYAIIGAVVGLFVLGIIGYLTYKHFTKQKIQYDNSNSYSNGNGYGNDGDGNDGDGNNGDGNDGDGNGNDGYDDVGDDE